jgi:four helix bundle protein
VNSKLPYASKYQDLVAYQKALDLSNRIFAVSKGFPREEAYSLTDQIRRSSRSVGAQIAEAWGKRMYVRHFISKLTDASSEIFETEHWILIAKKSDYINQETQQDLNRLCFHINKLIGGMIKKAHLFCDQPD